MHTITTHCSGFRHGPAALFLLALIGLVPGCKDSSKQEVASSPEPAAAPASTDDTRAITRDAYIYGFPVVDNYRIQYAYFVDRNDPEYKAPWNTLYNNARVYTPGRPRDTDAQFRHAVFLRRRRPARRAIGVQCSRHREGALLPPAVHRHVHAQLRVRGHARDLPRRRQLPAGRAGLEGRDACGHQLGDPFGNAVRVRRLPHAVVQSGRHRERQESAGRLQGAAAVEVPRPTRAARRAGATSPSRSASTTNASRSTSSRF